jgi:HTH-type transcriptional regulator/antitoxin HigA
VIGSRTRVYEVLRGDRPLTLAMIRRLHERLGISAEVLIRPVAKKRRRAA